MSIEFYMGNQVLTKNFLDGDKWTSKKKHSLTRKVWDIGIGGNGGVKRKGTRF